MGGLREQLQDIYDKHRELTPRLVVDEARPTEHPLHGRFEWDDSIAGEKYRQVQAAELIRSVKVTYRNTAGVERTVREWVKVSRDPDDAPGNIYRPTVEALADPLTRQMLLREFEMEWKAFKTRYSHLAEFAQVIARDLAAA